KKSGETFLFTFTYPCREQSLFFLLALARVFYLRFALGYLRWRAFLLLALRARFFMSRFALQSSVLVGNLC
ncbi:MAG: hypothetical protein IKD29_03340, partial [Lentisphaeria bacterium]|nr:hypothetical protein [Lentisphaeria bacterium]